MSTRSLAVVAGALLLVGCAGDGESHPFGGGDAGARRAGAMASEMTQAELGRVELPDLGAYLEAQVADLADGLPEPAVEWRVAVLDASSPLIAGFEGGHLLVSRGLLIAVPSEAALRRVLAGEMAHIALGHATSRLEVMAGREPVAAPGESARLVLPGLGRPLASVGSLLDSLQATPYTDEERVEAEPLIESLVARVAPPPEAGSLGFPAVLAGLAVGDDPRQGVIDGRVLLHRDLDLEITFPAGWEILNRADFIAALAPGREARVVLQLVGEGEDPLEPARAFAHRGGARFGLLPRAREIGQRPAARAFGSTGDASLDVTWIVHRDSVYQITGVCGPEDYERLQVDFIDVALSLRSLGSQDPERFLPELLHLETARPGETVEDVLARVGSSRDAVWVAAQSGLELGVELGPGTWVRIPQRARAQPPPPDDTAPEPQS